MLRKTQELTLVFGSAETGKSENIIDVLKNKKQQEKVYIIDYTGKYKQLLSSEQLEFNYLNIRDISYCNPLFFEPNINKLEGEDYSNEFSAHLEESVKLINFLPYTPLSDKTTRAVLTKMYKLAGITAEKYSPITQVDKVLNREIFYDILKDVDPDISQILKPLVNDLRKELNSKDLRSFFVPNHSIDTNEDFIVLDLDHYIAGENLLVDLKVESILLKLKRSMRNEGKSVILVVDGVWPMGQRFIRCFDNATEKMHVYYLNDEFSEFSKLNEEIIYISEEIRFHRSGYTDAKAASKYFGEPKLIDRILSLPYKGYLTIRPAEDTAKYGDYIYFKKDKQTIAWKIE